MTIFQDRNLEFSYITGFLKNRQTDINFKMKIKGIQRRGLEKYFTHLLAQTEDRQGKRSDSLSYCKYLMVCLF